MANLPVNATGWEYLMDGRMVYAVYHMFDSAFGNMGLIVVLLFFVYQLMLYWKTQNLTLMWIIGVFFASMYATSTFVKQTSVNIIFLLLVLELAGILYLMIFYKK